MLIVFHILRMRNSSRYGEFDDELEDYDDYENNDVYDRNYDAKQDREYGRARDRLRSRQPSRDFDRYNDDYGYY